ncbi:MAG: hypothetical protein E6R13_05105 [Spirochaetes bacterium]|nr:MAG: hypothetical protein E6R13_05105 [Spirochaetota bacterium]
MQLNSGIYKITNIVNNKFYIGSSTELNKRRVQHFCDLKAGRHKNLKLQYSYNKYGKDSFKFEILATCPHEYLMKLEQWFIDNQLPNYNILKTAYTSIGHKHSEETIKNHKIAAQKIKEIPLANSAFKLTKADVIEIKKMLKLGYFFREIQQKFSICKNTVYMINNNLTWRDVPDYEIQPNDIIKKEKPIRNKSLIDSQVTEIKQLLISGETLKNISKKFNVSISTIFRVSKNINQN